jgi:hypothetical protein
MTHPVAEKLLLEAIDRIARTPDGQLQYVWLQRQLMAVLPMTDPCALSTHHGERLFAARLIGHMAKGIIESGGRTGITGSDIGPGGTEQPIARPIPQPVAASPRTGAGRRITEHTRVPGWDPPEQA